MTPHNAYSADDIVALLNTSRESAGRSHDLDVRMAYRRQIWDALDALREDAKRRRDAETDPYRKLLLDGCVNGIGDAKRAISDLP